jgi:hypothetical protein
MSTRRLRARLDRLEKTPLPVGARSDFRIDPAVAKALRDDSMRVKELWRSRGYIGALSEEEAMLRARIGRLADTIVCPASYGAWQAREDARLMSERKLSPTTRDTPNWRRESPCLTGPPRVARGSALWNWGTKNAGR